MRILLRIKYARTLADELQHPVALGGLHHGIRNVLTPLARANELVDSVNELVRQCDVYSCLRPTHSGLSLAH